MPHPDRKVVVIPAARQEGVADLAVHQPLEVRHPVRALPAVSARRMRSFGGAVLLSIESSTFRSRPATSNAARKRSCTGHRSARIAPGSAGSAGPTALPGGRSGDLLHLDGHLGGLLRRVADGEDAVVSASDTARLSPMAARSLHRSPRRRWPRSRRPGSRRPAWRLRSCTPGSACPARRSCVAYARVRMADAQDVGPVRSRRRDACSVSTEGRRWPSTTPLPAPQSMSTTTMSSGFISS